ncbi:M20 family metallopeptidase [Naumannella halotolerans]|uniref:Peptidase M20 domain-containing protein 2 n=1 Tax=Naumannella halotolerans TaxID=993414 RepID=A0A4R7J1P3_9ACTN|nr:M20 family metallopeptidase [Naumannella halotolerans]TDT31071.1 amidohydrolase [Naumannella halotolerans]
MINSAAYHRQLDAMIESLGGELIGLSTRIHDLAETGFEEQRSAAGVAELLHRHGLSVEIGVHGLPTAVESRVGVGGPRVALMAEYDALPGIGHACGHNVIAACSIGAYLAPASVLQAGGPVGTAVLLGTPAEENGTGKEIMAREGAFDGIDAAFMIHPTGGLDTVGGSSLGLREVELVFTGRASHAAAAPEQGLNALDAAVATYQGINALRPGLQATDRVHGIITEGGLRPNIIPERAALHYYVRSAGVQQLLSISKKLEAVARGAVIMTGTEVEVIWDRNPACVPMQPNDALNGRFTDWLSELGRQVGERPPGSPMGSTDAGNVSVRIPTIHPMLAIADAEVSPHTAEFAVAARTPRAERTVLDGGRALAHIALDYLLDPDLRTAAAVDFDQARTPEVEELIR